jgi:hypothetical protein
MSKNEDSIFSNFLYYHFLVTDNTQDLFICGRCHTNFLDLNLFLTHRSTCNAQTITNLYPISTSPSTALLEGELDAIIQDVSLTMPTSSNLFYEEVSTTNEFDLLFSQPVQSDSNISERKEDFSIENGMSEMSLLECPVCDEQFDAPTILENHVFEHSTWMDGDENTNTKPGLSFDDSSSSYIDLFDEPSTISLECKQCTIAFASNASLNMHKKMSKHKILLFLLNLLINF